MKTLLFLALFFSSIAVRANYSANPVIWQDGKAFSLSPTMSFNGGSQISSGSVDPQAVPTEGNPGSIYLRDTGAVYIKTDSGTTINWNQVATGSGGVPATRQVNTTAPLTGGGDLSANRTIAIPAATALVDGFLKALDWITFNSKQDPLTFGNISTGTSGVVVSFGSSATVGPNTTVNISTATGSQQGLLGPTDFNTFNNKVSTSRTVNTTAPLTGGGNLSGDLTIVMPPATATTSGFLASPDFVTFNNKVPSTRNVNTTTPITGGGALSGDLTIVMPPATATTSGFLASPDFVTFNAKQPAGNYVTALTGEVTASGPGSVAATVTNSAVIGKVLTGYSSGAGTVAATDTILQAVNKLNGNDALKVPLTRNVNTTAPITGGGALSSDLTILMPPATATTSGFLASPDFVTFNAKVPPTRNVNTNAPLTGGGALSGDLTVVLPPATATTAGYLSAPDFVTFNAKQPAGNYITTLTGDVTASGPGSVASTVALVGGSTASAVNTGTILANGSTAVNSAGTIIRRDSNGDFNSSQANITKLYVNSTSYVLSGSADPTSSATAGDPGSLYMSSNGSIYKKNDSGTTTNWTIMTAGGGYENKLGFVIQPPTTGVPGIPFTTQPYVAIQDVLGNTVTRSVATVTLSAFTGSDCTTSGAGTVANNTKPAYQGISQYTFAAYNKTQTVYLKATNGTLTTGCSTGVTLNVPPGDLDITYGTSGITAGIASTVGLQDSLVARAYASAKMSDDRIVMVGTNNTPNATAQGRRWHIAMFKSDGTGLDPTFGTSGVVDTNANNIQSSVAEASDVAVDASDNIYVAGTYYNNTNNDWAVLKLNSSGTPVAAFGTSGQQVMALSSQSDRARQIYIDGGTLIVGGCSSCVTTTTGLAMGKYNVTTGATIVAPVFTTAGITVGAGVDLVNGAIGKLSTGQFVSAAYTTTPLAPEKWKITAWSNQLVFSGNASEVWSGTTASQGTLGFTQITDLVVDASDHIYAVGSVNVNTALGAAGNDISVRCWSGSALADCTGFGSGTKFNSGINSNTCPGHFSLGNDLAGKALIDGTSVVVAGAGLEISPNGYEALTLRVTSAGIMDSTYTNAMCNVAGLGDIAITRNTTSTIPTITPYYGVFGVQKNSFDGNYMGGFMQTDSASSPANEFFWNVMKVGD